MRAMKDAYDALIRTLIYLAVAVSLSVISGSISLCGVIFLWALAAAPGETTVIIRNTIHNRRLRLENQPTSELEVPDTRPLERKR